MSDDLVKRLRFGTLSYTKSSKMNIEAADRIEELEAELHLMKTSGIVEVAVRNQNVMKYIKHWEGRAEAAEAKLAKAVEALDWCATVHESSHARATLAELKGEEDDH